MQAKVIGTEHQRHDDAARAAERAVLTLLISAPTPCIKMADLLVQQVGGIIPPFILLTPSATAFKVSWSQKNLLLLWQTR